MSATCARLATATVGAALLLLVQGGTARAELKTVRVSMPDRTGASYAPYNIAVENGYYADEGVALDVKIAGGGISVPAQIAGDIDVNTSGIAAIIPILRGAHLKLVYTLATRSNAQIWSTSKELKSLQDLKGKQVGVISRGDTTEIGFVMTLAKAGLPSDWVSYTALNNISNVIATLKVGSFPAVVVPGITIGLARADGVLANGTLLYDELSNIEMPFNSLSVSDHYIENERPALEAFLRGTLKGVRFMTKHRTGTIAIMKKYSTGYSDPVLESDYDRVLSMLSPDGTAPEAARQLDLKIRAALIDLPEKQLPPLDQIYNYSIARAAAGQLDASGWTP